MDARTIGLGEWFASYATSPYGTADPHALAAWQVIGETAYGMTRADSWSEAPDGLFGTRPSLNADKAASWGPAADRYDTTAFDTALTELLLVTPALRKPSAYRHDLADIARQGLSNKSRILLPQIKAAYEAKDRTRFATMLASSEEGVHDYANREWSGLVGGLYLTHWKTYFAELTRALDEDRPPKSVDWFALEDGWARRHTSYPTRTKGDVHTLARRVRDTLTTDPHQVTLTASTSGGAVTEGPDRSAP